MLSRTAPCSVTTNCLPRFFKSIFELSENQGGIFVPSGKLADLPVCAKQDAERQTIWKRSRQSFAMTAVSDLSVKKTQFLVKPMLLKSLVRLVSDCSTPMRSSDEAP